MLWSSQKQFTKPVEAPLKIPDEAITIEEYQKLKSSKQEHFSPEYYQIGPEGDLYRAYEPIIHKYFPNYTSEQVNDLMKQIISGVNSIYCNSPFPNIN